MRKTCFPFFSHTVLAILLLVAGSGVFIASQGYAKSPYSPRHSGIEPPGGPHAPIAVPGRSAGRTAEGGMGYTDAYGNTIQNYEEQEKAPHHRLRKGAFGNDRQEKAKGTLPNPHTPENPVWKF